MKLSILITHYNRHEALNDCIGSFINLDLDLEFEIIVSDDGSFDQNFVFKHDSVKYLLSSKNYGLGASLNKGIKACEGDFILYCQEDFIADSKIKGFLEDIFCVLKTKQLDMIRLTANYKFPHLLKITEDIYRIPKFSFKNFFYNAFQYSDNPFIVRNEFFYERGFYLEDKRGHYCELEYAIRMMKSDVKIGILKKYMFSSNSKNFDSVLNPIQKYSKKRTGFIKFNKRFLRALRHHIEWLFYNPKLRKLHTYKS